MLATSIISILTILLGYFFLFHGKKRSPKERILGSLILFVIVSILYPFIKIMVGFFIEGSYHAPSDNRIVLQANTENRVHLGDTLLILASSCKGCEFSTQYSISDSLQLVQEINYQEFDDFPGTAGGSYRIELELVPKAMGQTRIDLFSYKMGVDNEEFPDSQRVASFPLIIDP